MSVNPNVDLVINKPTNALSVKTYNVNVCRMIAFSIEKQLPVKQFSVLLGSIDLTGIVREKGWMIDFFPHFLTQKETTASNGKPEPEHQ